MADIATRLPGFLRPDASRTVLRPFVVEDPSTSDCPRTRRVIDRILALDDAGLRDELQVLAVGLADRHRDVDRLLRRRYEELSSLMRDRAAATPDQCKLIGAYFSEEFSFKSAALFNPSVVPHPDQSRVEGGGLRILVSLRGVGEGHISSLAFRTGMWGADGAVTMDDPSKYAVGPRIERTKGRHGELIVHLLCDGAQEISETVVYPFMPSQGRGIEDVRLVEFTDDDGAKDYRATYTAFNGVDVRQGLLRTNDFKIFELRGVRGDLYSGKGMALFPRKIDGRYMMLGRQDNENIWLLSSHEFDAWSGGEKIISPQWPWEFIQMGNCGSPMRSMKDGSCSLTGSALSATTASARAFWTRRTRPRCSPGRGGPCWRPKAALETAMCRMWSTAAAPWCGIGRCCFHTGSPTTSRPSPPSSSTILSRL